MRALGERAFYRYPAQLAGFVERGLSRGANPESYGFWLPPARITGNPSGATVFEHACASCHREPGYSGTPVALEVVGTDPTVGRSRDRGTGTYEVPSLRGVGLRRRLLHDGAFASLDAMFAPERADDHLGHHFGLQLPDADRQALVEFVKGL